MNITEELISRLKSAVALVSSRVHRIKAPQTTLKPYIAVRQSQNGRRYVFNAVSTLSDPVVEIMCFATTYAGAAAVATQVITAVEGWPGANALVQTALLIDRNEDYEVETEIYSVSLEFQIYHE